MELFKYTPVSGHNFGDEVGPLIVNALADHEALKIGARFKRLLSVGSIVHFACAGDLVWGSGLNGKVGLSADCVRATYLSVRGPLTREVLTQAGAKVPEIYGDPAILYARLYRVDPCSVLDNKTLVIPNYNDFQRFDQMLRARPDRNKFVLVHPFSPLEVVLGLIAGAREVITSSLHALLFADQFGVPSSLVGGDDFAEHPFKYLDYAASLGETSLDFCTDLNDAAKNISDPRVVPNCLYEQVEQAFPWRECEPTGRPNYGL